MTYVITGMAFFFIWRNYSVSILRLRGSESFLLTCARTVGNRQASLAVVPVAGVPGHALRSFAHGTSCRGIPLPPRFGSN